VAGYSGTPLPKKLGISEGDRVAFRGAPETFRRTLGALPDGVTAPRLDVVVAFFTRRSDLERHLAKLMDALDVDGGLWISWPKGSSRVPTDITEAVVRDVGVARGMVDNKVCAIDETWSGLRLVYRRDDRAAIAAERST
jgi:hypothetical protein